VIIQIQSLENCINDAKTDLALEVEKKLCDMEHKLNLQMISQKEEFNKFKRDRSLEDRVRRIEADNAQMRMEFKVTNVRLLILATHQ
jgi:hypothetical protein